MDVSGIKSAQLNVSGELTGEIDDTEKSKVINRQEDTSHSDKIIEELGEKYNRENTKKTKPQLNRKLTEKPQDDKSSAKKISISELFSLLSDDLSGEQIKSSGINQSINNNVMKNIWSEKKESDLSESINNYAGILLGCVNELSERYFSVINNCDEMFDDIRLFFTEDKNIKINSKDEFSAFLTGSWELILF